MTFESNGGVILDPGSQYGISIIVGAAEVVAAVGAYQLALVSGETVGAGGADLAMVIDGQFAG
jgi:hypothetical protein